MNRNEFLDKVMKQHSGCRWVFPDAVKAARLGVTDSAVQERRAVLAGRRKALTTFNYGITSVTVLSWVWALLTLTWSMEARVVLCLGFTFAGIILLLASELIGCAIGRLGQRKWLDPIADSILCEYGLKYVNESESARQWRDLALEERSELRRFDIDIMHALDEQEKAEANQAAFRARIATACKGLHGVPAPAEA